MTQPDTELHQTPDVHSSSGTPGATNDLQHKPHNTATNISAGMHALSARAGKVSQARGAQGDSSFANNLWRFGLGFLYSGC